MALPESELSPTAMPRAGRRLLHASWVVATLIALLQIALPVERHIIEFGIGDALVYARVAFNVAQGMGSTYSLETPTNGYHPLWLALQVPLFVGSADIVSRLGLAKAFWALTTLANAVAWSLFVRRTGRSEAAGALACLLFAGFGWSLFVLYSGIETPLALLLLCATYAVAVRLGECGKADAEPGTRLLLAYGLAGTLTFLARLDSLFLLLCTLPLAAPGLLRTRLPRLLWAGLPLVLALPYFAWNLSVMQTLMPVSGLVKTSADPGLANAGRLLEGWGVRMARIGVPGPLVALAGVAGLVPAGLLLWAIRRRVPVLGSVLLAVFAGATAQYLYYLFCMTELNVPWHMYPQFAFGYLLLCGIVAWAGSFGRPLANQAFVGLLCTCAALTGFYALAKQTRQIETETALAAGHWMQANLPAGSCVLMQDSFSIGALAPEIHFVDMSGLVEDKAGALAVKQRGPMALLEQHRVTHSVIHSRDTQTPVDQLTNLHRPYDDAVLRPVLLKSFPYDRGSAGRFLIYALQPLEQGGAGEGEGG